MKQSGRQSGFGTTVVLLAILVIALLALTTVVIYQHHKTNSIKSNVSTNTPQTTTKQKSTTITNPSPTPTPTPPSQSTNSFAIPEIHAEITLPSGLTSSNLKYSISTSTGVPVANFTTASLESAAGGNSCNGSNGGIGSIWRTTQAPPSSSPVVKQIGQYYYYFEEPQQPCSANQSAEQLETTQTTELKQAFETITVTN